MTRKIAKNNTGFSNKEGLRFDSSSHWGAWDRPHDNYQFKEMGRKILYHLSIVGNGVQKLIGRPVVLEKVMPYFSGPH
jgi:hypothetical protein